MTLSELPIMAISRRKLLVSIRREKSRTHKSPKTLREEIMQNIKCYSTFSSNYDISNRPHDTRTFEYKFLFLFRNKKDQKSAIWESKTSCRFRKHIQNLPKENSVHCDHLLSGTLRKLLPTAAFSRIRKSTN